MCHLKPWPQHWFWAYLPYSFWCTQCACNVAGAIAGVPGSLARTTIIQKTSTPFVHAFKLFIVRIADNQPVLNRYVTNSFSRAATGGKVAKAWSLAVFWEIEKGGGCGGATVKLPPLWRPCPPKIYHCGPVQYIKGHIPSYIYSWSIGHILEHEFFC